MRPPVREARGVPTGYWFSPVLHGVRFLLGKPHSFCQEVSLRWARRNSVNTDVFGSKLECPAASHVFKCGFTRTIVRQSRSSLMSECTGDVNDVAFRGFQMRSAAVASSEGPKTFTAKMSAMA